MVRAFRIVSSRRSYEIKAENQNTFWRALTLSFRRRTYENRGGEPEQDQSGVSATHQGANRDDGLEGHVAE